MFEWKISAKKYESHGDLNSSEVRQKRLLLHIDISSGNRLGKLLNINKKRTKIDTEMRLIFLINAIRSCSRNGVDFTYICKFGIEKANKNNNSNASTASFLHTIYSHE